MEGTSITIFGICFIFVMTSLGAAIIFLVKKTISEKYNVFFMSFAGGIMLASSIWSLLIPAIDNSENYASLAFLPACLGFLLGCLFLYGLDILLEKTESQKDEFVKRKMSKNQRMFFVISIHNIPEGLSVGVAFGSVLSGGGNILLALSLAIGIGIQNIPEGFAVSLPMYSQTKSKWKAFLYGIFSGILEPISAIVGLYLSSIFTFLLPWMLAFAGGTMIYTIVNELLPGSQVDDMKRRGTWGFIFGFLLMMVLDVAFA